MALLAWWFSPSKVLPTPPEVVAAPGTMWMEQGLGQEIITSFLLNLEALAWTALISLGLSYLTVLPFFRPIASAVAKGRFLGLIGLTFVFTLMVGGGRPLKVSLLVFGMTVFFVTSMAAEIEGCRRRSSITRGTLRMSEWQVVYARW